MKEKELRIIITFHTTAAAISMEKRARELGLKGKIISVPRQLSSGCGLSWSEPAANKELLRQLIDNVDFEIEGIYELRL